VNNGRIENTPIAAKNTLHTWEPLTEHKSLVELPFMSDYWIEEIFRKKKMTASPLIWAEEVVILFQFAISESLGPTP